MSELRESYEDTLTAAEDADLLVSHPLALATGLVAERTGIPWASTVLQPGLFFSAYDPPAFGEAANLSRMSFLGPWFYRPVIRLLKRSYRSWVHPWYQLRAEIGLLPTAISPLFDGHSLSLVLALFSSVLAARKPDWPANTVVTGFPFFDEDGEVALSPGLRRFLADGSPPLVFTLGSSAVMAAGAFYEHIAAAAALLGRRGVLLVGQDPRNRPAKLPEGVIVVDYVPNAALLPRAAAAVHQGGIGTTAQAMRAGRPMLVVPFSHDQPDNARRVTRLGIAHTVKRDDYSPQRAAREHELLLGNPDYARRAAEIGRRIAAEDGVATACDALESLVRIAE